MANKQVNLYLCGGASTNIGSSFTKYNGKPAEGFAEIKTFFIDTSKSNLNPNIPSDYVYLVDGVDGSGKKRDSNYTALVECSHEILHRFKPSIINVVVHSAGGGTGSTIGPILVSSLLERGENVVVLTIGSTSSRIEVENTIKTLKSYEVIAKKRDKPVSMFYRENSTDKPRSMVDSDIESAILMLATIFSGDNRELDTSDLRNFINYNKVTSYQPRLALLEFFFKDIIVGKGQSLVSLVTLVDEKTSSDVGILVEYQTVGYLPESTKPLINEPLPIHGCIISGYFNGVIDSLELKLKDYDEGRNVVVERSIIKDDIEHTDMGLIL